MELMYNYFLLFFKEMDTNRGRDVFPYNCMQNWTTAAISFVQEGERNYVLVTNYVLENMVK